MGNILATTRGILTITKKNKTKYWNFIFEKNLTLAVPTYLPKPEEFPPTQKNITQKIKIFKKNLTLELWKHSSIKLFQSLKLALFQVLSILEEGQ